MPRSRKQEPAIITAWQITDRDYAGTAFDGVGAEKFGGRLNSIGRRVVYCAGSQSLAILEQLVRVNSRSRLRRQVCMRVEFDARMVETLDHSKLPRGWDAIPYTDVSQRVGDGWLERQSSAVLRVPSVVVPEEWNYLLNPGHPDFVRISKGASQPLPIDERF